MVKIDENNVDTITGIPEQYHELAKDLIRLKQRMDSDKEGKPLTDYVKYESSTKIERNPTIEKNDLNGFSKDVADMMDIDKFMEYQIESWEFIDSNFNNPNKNLIIDAGTGFGKTEAVIPAVIKKVLDDDALAILIFPRRALLIDQIQRIMRYNVNKILKIGIQIAGISPKIEWTIYNSEDQKNRYIKAPNGNITKMNKNINSLVHTNYHFEDDLFAVDYENLDHDRVQINLFKCGCGGSFENLASFSKYRSGRYEKRKKFAAMNNNHNYYWKCNKDNKIIHSAFSREDQIDLRPNIIFTTIDSLLSIISDPDMGEYIKEKLKAVVFDEVHVYNSLYGGHALEIIKKIREVIKRNIFIAGLSATIDMPGLFGEKLFGTEVEVIEPTSNDVKKIDDKEKYFFIMSSVDKRLLYSLKTQNMIQTSILLASSIDKKTIAFMDSINAVVNLSKQTNDAYNVKKLPSFRLDDPTYMFSSCKGLSDTCRLSCSIYQNGECWNILRKMMGMDDSPKMININPVYSDALISREALQNAKMIFSTSELQLGIDLPDVEYLIQYGTPYTIFDYIQRKGRAGRSPGSEPVFMFVLGDSSNDYIYFSYGSSILNKRYILPLEGTNKVITKLYSSLFKYYEYANDEYKKIKNNYKEDEVYIPKFIASWLAIFNGSELDEEFISFLNDNFNTSAASVAIINSYEDMKNFKDTSYSRVDELKNNKINELNELLKPYDREMPSQYLNEKMTEIISELSQDSEILPKDTEDLNTLKERVIRDIEDNKPSYDDEKLLFKKLNEINSKLFDSPLVIKISNIINKIYIHSHSSNSDINSIQQNARKLFFTIQSLKELGMAFQRTLTSEVIKYMLRANYFYAVPFILSKEIREQFPVMPPVNLFSASSREIPLIESSSYVKTNENIDIKDTIFKYFPFRLNATPLNNFKKMANPKIEKDKEKYYFDPIEVMDPVQFYFSKDIIAIMPLSFKVDTIKDDGLNDIISYCKKCIAFYDYNKYTCTKCSGTLSKVSIYASPLVKTHITAESWDEVANNVFISYSTVTICLEGVRLSIVYQYYNDEDRRHHPILTQKPDIMNVDSKQPYGYQVLTNALKIDIGREKIKSLHDKFINKFSNRNNSEDFVNDVVLHSLSHFWLKTIAVTVGISPDQFVYEYNNSSIIISELQEGGAGYLKAFIEYLRFRTKDVYNIMKEIIECEEHESIFSCENKKRIYEEFKNIDFKEIDLNEHQRIIDEIKLENPSLSVSIEDYPVCYDGCPYCIGLTSCKYGSGDKQFNYLSLEIAVEYVNSLIKRTDNKKEAASLISQGGFIIDTNGEDYVIFSL